MFRVQMIIGGCLLMSTTVYGGLVGYWDFNRNVMDQSEQGNHGELVGASYVNDVPDALGVGQSLSFEDHGEHVFIAADPSLNSDVFTLSMFVNDQDQIDPGVSRLTSRQADSFETGLNQAALPSDTISYYAGSWVQTEFAPDIDAWHHLAFVADGETMTVYVDGESAFGPRPFGSSPSGFMHIGNRWNDAEGFFGLMDDVALWDAALPAESISALANGTQSPLEIPIPDPPPPPPQPFLTVGSSVDTWQLSTELIDGGGREDWLPDGETPPALDTFTLEPLPTSPTVMGHIEAAAIQLEVEGIQADNDVHYYRTTFDLERAGGFNAELQLAVDNGAHVFINGELLATETSFVVANWAFPLPSLAIAEDGTIDVIKFDDAAQSFDGWRVGENEIVLAVRNPFDENAPAGGFAFRLDFFGSGVVGDFDNNGVVDAVDIDELNEQIAGQQDPSFDLNGDRIVDAADRDSMVADVLGTYYGDANLDLEFNTADLVSVFTVGEYEDARPLNSTWSTGDWNGDREFNSSDFVIAFADGGFEQGPRQAIPPVPEPSSILLLILGVVGIRLYRRNGMLDRP